MTELLPCPFCNGSELRIDLMYFDDDGEHPGVECLGCDALARADRWNQRPVCEWTESEYWYTTGCGVGEHVFDVPRGPFCFNCGGKVEVPSDE